MMMMAAAFVSHGDRLQHRRLSPQRRSSRSQPSSGPYQQCAETLPLTRWPFVVVPVMRASPVWVTV